MPNMSEQRKIAVILVRSDTSLTPPTIADCKALMLSGQNSIARYWQENTYNWFQFTAFDFFGSYDIMLPPPPNKRQTIWDSANAAATSAGVNLADYDSFVVLDFPGVSNDHGAIDRVAVVGIPDNHTFFCHEFGHVLGFSHTYGILNAGSDWSDDGVTQLNPVYGDPYDIMSSATFGNSDPTTILPTPFTGFPGSASVGPMLSRALLHFTKPMALDLKQKVRHIYEDGNSPVFQLFPAANGNDQEPELVVFHPSGEDTEGRGRIYVEYRQPRDFLLGTRWDNGLAVDGDNRDRRGVIVHVVKNIPETTTPAVWYAGRICFPTPDSDVVIDTPQGTAIVTVSDDYVQQNQPYSVAVRVTRQTRARVSIRTETKDDIRVTSSEKRSIPGWEWAGQFTWEQRKTIRTVRYTPITAGIGGKSPFDAATTVKVYWYVNNYMLTSDSGMEKVLPLGTIDPVRIHFSVDPLTRVLTLYNEPDDGAVIFPIQASASDSSTWATPITAESKYEVEGFSEGWGHDYKDFMDFWYQITHPIPIPEFGPPRPDDYRIAIERLRQPFERMQVSNPVLAARIQTLLIDQTRVLRNFQQSVSLQLPAETARWLK
jgi:hypothetical protein